MAALMVAAVATVEAAAVTAAAAAAAFLDEPFPSNAYEIRTDLVYRFFFISLMPHATVFLSFAEYSMV